ncbi:MAG TPA: translation initiation factor Sui1 [Thermoanaerobaculia bacterium]|mgnify:CR=1 FL=1|nr:translation initiation factor Sui1 [Thermoanaerobaculia bacterium]
MTTKRNAARPGVVYSTQHGRVCPRCGWPVDRCACSQPAAKPKGDGIVRVGRETQGRKGKGVTVVSGVLLAEAELGELASELKRRCGSGGTLKDGVIEIQGEHRDLLVELLTARGFKVKRSGG